MSELRNNPQSETPVEISEKRLRQAKVLYNTISQHKSVFIQAASSDMKGKSSVNIKTVKSFRERIVRAVCKSPGPLVTVRVLQKHMKGSLVDNIKIELDELQRRGFGTLKQIMNRGSRLVFFKVPAEHIDVEIGNQVEILKMSNMSVETYEATYNDISKLDGDLKDMCRQHHPQIEEIQDMLI